MAPKHSSNALVLGVDKYVAQGPQQQIRAVRDRAPSLAQEPACRCDSAGDGGAVDAEQAPQH